MFNSWQWVVRGCSRCFLAAVAVTYSALAPALGLGEITLYSALNQPLRADIALVDDVGVDDHELSVSLATAEEFGRAGVDRAPFLGGLQFTPIQRGDHRLIRVTSSQSVNEPFLNFLVQLNQANGRWVREYTVLLDPPGSVQLSAEPVAPSANPPSIEPVSVPPPATDVPAPSPATVASGPVATQADASVQEPRQLQASIDELKARLQDQGEQLVEQKKQLTELQNQWQDERRAIAQSSTPTPEVAEESATDWRLMLGLPALLVLAGLWWFVRRSREQHQPESAEEPPWEDFEPPLSPAPSWRQTQLNQQDAPGETPKPVHSRPIVAPAPTLAVMAEATFDEYRLHLDEPSINAESPDTSVPSLTLEPLNLEPDESFTARV